MHVCSVSNVLKKEKEKNVGGTGKRRVAGGQPEMALHRGRKSGRKEVFSQHRPGRGFLLSSSTLSLSLSLFSFCRGCTRSRVHTHTYLASCSRDLEPEPTNSRRFVSPLSLPTLLSLFQARRKSMRRGVCCYIIHTRFVPRFSFSFREIHRAVKILSLPVFCERREVSFTWMIIEAPSRRIQFCRCWNR